MLYPHEDICATVTKQQQPNLYCTEHHPISDDEDVPKYPARTSRERDGWQGVIETGRGLCGLPQCFADSYAYTGTYECMLEMLGVLTQKSSFPRSPFSPGAIGEGRL